MSSDILSVHGEYTLRGHRRTTVQIHRAGVVWIRGTREGRLLIEPGGTAHVFGPVSTMGGCSTFALPTRFRSVMSRRP